ncbi:conjugal transfer protein [Nocardia mikamii]|uniref:conjugal transfer protein n=1 Tax=Nocardia mikamii TaxID=508464 RepID=UPI001FE0FFA2|nr:conjugal transfer protein [Nocardia mikamii]
MRTSAGRRADSGEELLRRMAARRRRDNAVFAVLAVLAVLGGGHAVLSWFATPPPGPSDATTTTIVGNAQLAESFAQEFVVTYLSATNGQQEKLAEFVDAQQMTLPSTPRQVSDPIVVFASRSIGNSSLDVWAVTVSVRVAKTGAAGGLREYYRVPVSVAADGRRRALALPSAVGAPGRGNDLVLNYEISCGTETPLAQVASGFLAAYLTGSGDVARYVAPNSGIAALQPAPYTAVETTTVSSEDASCGASANSAKVLATINPKAGAGAAPTLAYPLTMIRNSGQWQVQSMDALPALRNPMAVVSGAQTQDSAKASASGTPTTAPSTAVSVPPATQN